jgi:hypothetical protein
MSADDIGSYIGLMLFGISEIIALLPIPANGFLHSLTMGLQNSLKLKDIDIEIAHILINKNPLIVKVVKNLYANPLLIKVIDSLNNNLHITPIIDKIIKNNDLEYINTILINNPEIENDVKQFINCQLSKINKYTYN